MSNPLQQSSSQDQDQDQDQGSSALSPTAHSNNKQTSQSITVNGDRVEEEQHEEVHQSHDLEDDDNEEEEYESQDYYDPHGEIAQYDEHKLEIEESWLEWERQAQANNRHTYIFQKPGSTKRRDRRERYAQLQMHRQGSSSSSSSSGTASGSASAPGLVDPGSSSDSLVAIEKLRRLGSYRPALASSIVHSYSNLSWEAVQAAREKRLAAKAIASGSG